MVDIQLLRAIPAFHDVKKNEQDILARAFQKKTLPINGRIFQAGDSVEWIGWIVKGAIGIRHSASDYNNGIIEQGEVIAERALLPNNSLHHHTAIALTETTIITVPTHTLSTLHKDHPDIYLYITTRVLENLSSRLDHSTNKLFAIHAMSTVLNTPSLSVSLFGKRVLDIITTVIPIERGIIGIFDSFNQRLMVIEHTPASSPLQKPYIPVHSDSLLFHALQSRRITLLSSHDIQKNPQWYFSHNGLIAPLANTDHILGAILLSHKLTATEFSSNNTMLMESITAMASSKIDEHFRVREQLAETEHAQTSVYF